MTTTIGSVPPIRFPGNSRPVTPQSEAAVVLILPVLRIEYEPSRRTAPFRHQPTATPELPLGAAAAADGGRDVPSSAAVRNVIVFHARPARPSSMRLAGEVLPLLPHSPE